MLRRFARTTSEVQCTLAQTRVVDATLRRPERFVNTKLLMSLSAAFMAALGICATFLPQEIMARAGCACGGAGILVIQVAGSLYLGFAMLNWMARSNLIGGIYSRPVAVGNFLHFAVVAITMIKAIFGGSLRTSEAMVGCAVYSAFAVWFGVVVFTHPIRNTSNTPDHSHTE